MNGEARDDAVARIKAAVEAVLAAREDLEFAFVFGSLASGQLRQDSDIDVAVYFHSPAADRSIDVEEDVRFDAEDELQGELERACGREVDLIILNRAPVTLAAAAVGYGRPAAVRNPGLLRRFEAAVGRAAEDFRGFTEDFARVKARSKSLSETDRARLIRLLDYLESEMNDVVEFTGITKARYESDSGFRRNVERWAENLVNCSIDIAKMVLASERRSMPETYRETLSSLGTVEGFETLGGRLARFARVRNLLAHEYLDFRYPEIEGLVEGAEEVFGGLAVAARDWAGL